MMSLRSTTSGNAKLTPICSIPPSGDYHRLTGRGQSRLGKADGANVRVGLEVHRLRQLQKGYVVVHLNQDIFVFFIQILLCFMARASITMDALSVCVFWSKSPRVT